MIIIAVNFTIWIYGLGPDGMMDISEFAQLKTLPLNLCTNEQGAIQVVL